VEFIIFSPMNHTKLINQDVCRKDSTVNHDRCFVRYLFKIVSIIGIIFVTVYFAQGIFRFLSLFHQPLEVTETTLQDESVVIPDIQSLNDSNGNWLIYNKNWNCNSRIVTAAEFPAIWQELTVINPTNALELPVEDNSVTDKIDRSADSIIQLFKPFAELREETNGIKSYRFEQEGFHLKFFTFTQSGKEQILRWILALSIVNDKILLLELTYPKTDHVSTLTVNNLPLPKQSVVALSRLNQNKEPVFQMVTVNTSVMELVPLWKNAGWNVYNAVTAPTDSFSAQCCQKNQTVYVWSHDLPQHITTLILFSTMRLPE
jgi:hypothetical protein